MKTSTVILLGVSFLESLWYSQNQQGPFSIFATTTDAEWLKNAPGQKFFRNNVRLVGKKVIKNPCSPKPFFCKKESTTEKYMYMHKTVLNANLH